MNITLLGMDVAKNIFQLHGVDNKGKIQLQKRLVRAKLLAFIGQLPPCTIAMEACGSAHYWGRKFMELGHEVKLISPQFVKPYVKSQKNDYNDAQAIAEAASRPHMRFVAVKSVEQQDIQGVHRLRSRLVQARTALINQIRGLLSEYGIIIPQGIQRVRKAIPLILEDAENGLTDLARELFADLQTELHDIDKRVKAYDKRIDIIAKQQEACQRLIQMEGIGNLGATALVAAVGDPNLFKNGRQMAAWLGLVPRQSSSGNKQRLLGISKQGDCYLRTLLIHGARSVVMGCEKKQDKRSQWLANIKQRRGTNKAAVALANKNARIIWALLAHGDVYKKAA